LEIRQLHELCRACLPVDDEYDASLATISGSTS
jgi:hypothetical protein